MLLTVIKIEDAYISLIYMIMYVITYGYIACMCFGVVCGFVCVGETYAPLLFLIPHVLYIYCLAQPSPR